MTLMQTHHFSVKVYCLISLICPIILISHIVQLLLICKFYYYHKGPHINMCDIIIYVAQWWGKYLSKLSPLKHTCLWCDKLIVLWILNRQVKIFLPKILNPKILKFFILHPILVKISQFEFFVMTDYIFKW